MKKHQVVATIFAFVLLMTAGRLLWIDFLKPSDQPYAVGGRLDLQGSEARFGGTITLDGEWDFYPGVFLMDRERERGVRQAPESAIKVHVPSKWNEWMQAGTETPYGYGSYRLTIQVGAEAGDEVYSIYVPSVRTSSELYINGKRMAHSGRPASTAQEYEAENLPYIATFMADEHGTIELVIQAANYSDPRSGGLIRSLKFGSDEAIYREKQLSLATQYLIAAALLFQAAYLVIFYGIERKPFWLFCALAILSYTLMMLNSSEDKILHQWLHISYAWGYKLLCLSLTVLMYSLLRMTSGQLSATWRVPVVRTYSAMAVVGIVASIALPPQSSETLQYVIFLCASPVIVLLFVSVLRMAVRGIAGSIMQLLAILAFANHMLWWFIFLLTGIKVIHYPFDLIAAMILFSSIWIRRYYDLYTEQRELASKLEEVNRRKDDFLASTSHELRNPLHGMIGMSQVVLERERETMGDASIRDMETMIQIGRRMSFLLHDLLDTVRLKDSSLRLQLTGVALQPIVDGVMDMIRFMTNGKPVLLKNRVPESFPNVVADENRLIQILFNLLHNAAKFTHRGEIAVEASTENDRAFIIVSDTGVGMDAETRRRVFEPYEQGSANSGYEGGFGLGLSICKQLVELQGGSIEVRSAPDQGSRFIFSLAIDHGVEAEGSATRSDSGGVEVSEEANGAYLRSIDRTPYLEAAPALAEPVERYVKDKARILAVDDDALNLNVLVSLLSGGTYEVAAAATGEDALRLLQEQEWDLVITDIMMPRMSGYELTQRIRERYTRSELPVLVLTARARPEDIENGFLAGANDYVSKPVDARELRARVQALTQMASSSRERVRMEAAWLQAQIEPHFFFNTLNSIVALHTVDPEQMLQLVDHFSDYLREKFKFQNVGELVSLSDELTLVRSYLFIEQTRFDWLQAEWEVDNGLNVQIPPYSIQPLVENAVRHGLMQRRQDATVRIKIARHEDGVVISVADNGVGIDEGRAAELLQSGTGTGIALRNIDLRLQRLYGSGLRIASMPGAGTTVSFVIR